MAEIVQTFTVASRGVGLPDYSTSAPVGQVPVGSVFTSSDNAELAARLGSVVTLDRRGNVFWMDNFESGLSKWVGADASSPPGSVSLSISECRLGSTSCKMVTAPFAGVLGRAWLYTYLPCPAPPVSLPSLGFEVGFTSFGFVSNPEIMFLLRFYDQNGDSYEGYIIYKGSDHKLYYRNSAGADIEFASDIFTAEAGLVFHSGKLVIDPSENKYVRFLLDGVEYQMDNYSLFNTAAGVSPFIEIWIQMNNTAAASSASYIDTVIATHNEPINL